MEKSEQSIFKKLEKQQEELQTVFDRVKKHLLTQQRISKNDSGQCCYRTPAQSGSEYLRCAVGCLIADEHYDPTLEGVTVKPYGWIKSDFDLNLLKKDVWSLLDVLKRSGINSCNISMLKLLARLQDIHDSGEISYWDTLLEKLAQELGLKYE